MTLTFKNETHNIALSDVAGSGGSDLALPFTHLLKSYKDKDPVPRPQVALPARKALFRNDGTGLLQKGQHLRPSLPIFIAAGDH